MKIADFNKLIEGAIPIDNAVLHAACLFAGGRTESTLTQVKVPGILLYWKPGDALYFKVKEQVGCIPAAGVKICNFK
jgi:hypothetical protein